MYVRNDALRRKHIRLSPDRYADPASVVSVIVAVRDRNPIFGNAAFSCACHRALCGYFEQRHITVFAWVLMPDHAHFCLSPHVDHSVMQVISDIKQSTTRIAWSHGIQGQIWQRSFYDHFLRLDEDIEAVCRYIWMNPVRKGICAAPELYPYSGSTVFDWVALCTARAGM
ncbi:transposase [Candidatus Uhrbacteria bacterium]|nr:transposase [Candidatus Uhrbacteria bacterium]